MVASNDESMKYGTFVCAALVEGGLTGDFIVSAGVQWENQNFYKTLTVAVYSGEVVNMKKMSANNCADMTQNGQKWYMSEYGSQYDCAWLSGSSSYCGMYGHHKGFDYTVEGNVACHTCGGGTCDYAEDSSDNGTTAHYLYGSAPKHSSN